jgi:hypothetical protein
MLTRLLRQALRSPLPELARGVRFWRRHGARVRHARVLCQCADGLRLRRPRRWEARSVRLYRRAVSTLGPLASVQGGALAADPALDAHAALHQASAAYREFAAALSRLVAGLLTAALLAVIAACALSPAFRLRLFPRDLAAGRPWNAGSGALGLPATGVGPRSDGNIFFHTEAVKNPAVEIDLGGEHVVRSILVENRPDCCQERALPLDVEIWDGGGWRLIAERRAAFKVWKYDVGPVRTSKIRFRHPGTGYFHLKRISVYGQ